MTTMIMTLCSPACYRPTKEAGTVAAAVSRRLKADVSRTARLDTRSRPTSMASR